MPTALHRFTLTETPQLRHAIDIAAVTWPELKNDRARILRRIVEIGSHTVQAQREAEVAKRRAAIRTFAGAATGAFPADAAALLKAEWPE